MGKVYRVGSIYGTYYVNTMREAVRIKPGDDEPDSIERLDPAEACGQLGKELEAAEDSYNAVRSILEALCEVCPDSILEGPEGRAALQYLAANPLPPATAAERDGQRSYGT